MDGGDDDDVTMGWLQREMVAPLVLCRQTTAGTRPLARNEAMARSSSSDTAAGMTNMAG
jgi:hypothetical protein